MQSASAWNLVMLALAFYSCGQSKQEGINRSLASSARVKELRKHGGVHPKITPHEETGPLVLGLDGEVHFRPIRSFELLGHALQLESITHDIFTCRMQSNEALCTPSLFLPFSLIRQLAFGEDSSPCYARSHE